jgi:hypothetical protein
MMELFKANLDAKTSPNPSYPKGGEGKKKKKCPHCRMEVYHKPEACFKLEANASKRQQWQPGEVVITKLKKRFFPYLFASGLDPPPYNELQKGQMKQTKQGVRSTKVVDADKMLGFQQKPGVKHKDVHLLIFDATEKSMYSDQTGKFPISSAQGNKYIMVAVEIDGNYIDCEPIQSRKAKALTNAYQAVFRRWKTTVVICPNWHILNNEAPEELKQVIRENNCRVELTPADQHRRNAAERAIQTFKGHFISVLAGVDISFPINQWDKLLPQTILTLNILRQSNVAPNISAWVYHHGSFDYNRMPIAPMGCAVQFHIKPVRRKTFGEHSEDGFYLKT